MRLSYFSICRSTQFPRHGDQYFSWSKPPANAANQATRQEPLNLFEAFDALTVDVTTSFRHIQPTEQSAHTPYRVSVASRQSRIRVEQRLHTSTSSYKLPRSQLPKGQIYRAKPTRRQHLCTEMRGEVGWGGMGDSPYQVTRVGPLNSKNPFPMYPSAGGKALLM